MMLKKVWDYVKDNLGTIIAIGTVALTIIYAILKLVIYVYWKGYFDELNIDHSYMNLNYDNTIFSVVSVGVIFLAIYYLMCLVNKLCSWVYIKLWDRSAKRLIKMLKFSAIGIINFILANIYLFIGNLPLTIVLYISSQVELSLTNLCIGILQWNILEILLLIVHEWNKRDKNEENEDKNNGKIDTRIGSYLLLVVVCACFGLTSIYYLGSEAIENEKKLKLVRNREYVVTYSDGEQYILHRVQIENEMATIYRNEQLVIDNKDCECLVMKIENIQITDEYFVQMIENNSTNIGTTAFH